MVTNVSLYLLLQLLLLLLLALDRSYPVLKLVDIVFDLEKAK